MSAAVRLAALAAVPAAMLLLGLTAVSAKAQTPASVCTGQAPADGVLRGPVLLVEDGATLCVALGPTPDQWVKVRLSDATAPSGLTRVSTRPETARGALMAAAFSQTVDCQVADGQGVCRLDGRSVADLAAQPAVKTAGAAWR